jgi:adhesin transport system outer membrane protein
MRKTFTAMMATAIIATPSLVSAETLTEAVARAISTHPDVASAEAEVRARQQTVEEERSGFFPTLDFTVFGGYDYLQNNTTRAVHANPADGDGIDAFSNTSQIQVTQMVFDGFDTLSRTRAADTRAQVAGDQLIDQRESIALQASQAYLQVLRDRLIEELAVENVKNHTAVRDDMRVKTEGGGNSVADLRQAESRLSLAQARLEQVRGTLRDSISNYLQVVGALPGQLEAPEIPASSFPQNVDEAIALALDGNPGVNAAVKTVSARKYDLETAESPFWPNVSLEFTQTRTKNAGGVRNSSTHGLTAFAVLRYNAFRGGRDKARRQRAIEQISQATHDEASARRQVEEQMRLDYNSFEVARRRIPLLEQRVDQSSEVLKAYSEQFALGQRSLLDVLDVENELFQAEVDLATTESDMIFGQVRVLATIGSLVSTLGADKTEKSGS